MIRTVVRRALRVLFVSSVALAVACSSTGTRAAKAARVSFVDFRLGTVLTIVNESHTDRLEFYSQERTDTSTKVASDEVLGALIEYIDEQGFGKFARGGPAPSQSDDWTQSIEVSDGDGARHMLVRSGVTADQASTFRGSRDAFISIYNNVYQAQAIQVDPGEQPFKQAVPPSRK